jgi:hypothetical protein
MKAQRQTTFTAISLLLLFSALAAGASAHPMVYNLDDKDESGAVGVQYAAAFAPQSHNTMNSAALYLRFRKAAPVAESDIPAEEYVQPFMRFRRRSSKALIPAATHLYAVEQKRLYNLAQLRAVKKATAATAHGAWRKFNWGVVL